MLLAPICESSTKYKQWNCFSNCSLQSNIVDRQRQANIGNMTYYAGTSFSLQICTRMKGMKQLLEMYCVVASARFVIIILCVKVFVSVMCRSSLYLQNGKQNQLL